MYSIPYNTYRISQKNNIQMAVYPPTESFDGYSDEPGVRPSSVRPYVNIFVSAQ